MILCGHYKGIDQRIRDNLITREISIGDYVLTGGELPACIMTDAIVRLIPGAMSDESSALSDSFQDNLLAPPVYTRPAEFNGWGVPEVLLSGNHAKIREWQEQQAYERTRLLRPDLLEELVCLSGYSKECILREREEGFVLNEEYEKILWSYGSSILTVNSL